MLVADSFVVINYPKTGTSFLRKVLKRIHGIPDNRVYRLLSRWGIARPPIREYLFPKLYGDYPTSYRDQHGVYRQIPDRHRDKPVVSIVRNPLEKYLSSYVYGWWKNHPPFPLEQVERQWPNFPDLTFPEFHDLIHHEQVDEDKLNVPGASSLGSYTRMFIVFFAKDPDAACRHVLSGGSLADVLPAIRFLRQEHLRDDLADFLRENGYSEQQFGSIYDLKDQNVSSASRKDSVAAEDLSIVAARCLKKDAALLEMFPAYESQIAESARDAAA